MTKRHTYLEFFSGGGFARIGLGARWRCLLANDIDPAKCAAYRENFGGEELIEGDVAKLTLETLPRERADLAWASFPCQDLSLAGARGGLKSSRSGAFYGFWNAVEALRQAGRSPRLVVIENVTGLLTSNGGRDLAAVADAMARTGYRVAAAVIDARHFTPQSRPRLFIFGFGADVASPFAARNNAPSHFESALGNFSKAARNAWIPIDIEPSMHRNMRLCDVIDWNTPEWFSEDETRRLTAMMSETQQARLDAVMRSGARRAGAGFRRTRVENGKTVQRFEARFDGLAGCLRTPAGGSSRQIVIAIDKGRLRMRLINSREAARLMGAPDDYRLPQGATAALKLCGDGVCPPVVQWIAETVLEPALSSRRAAAA